MIRDYESGSGLKGVLDSLIGERVVGVLCIDNAITIFFQTGSAVRIRAGDYGAIVIGPLNPDDASAYVKRLVRGADKRLADLDLTIQRLVECKCAGNSAVTYIHSDKEESNG